MVIYSTLIDAATEHVEIFGKAGSTTIREIKIDNPQDSTIVLFIEKVSFTIKNHGDQGSMDSQVCDSWTFIGCLFRFFQPRNHLSFPAQHGLSKAENGQLVLNLEPQEELVLRIEFSPVIPNDSFSSVIDVTRI